MEQSALTAGIFYSESKLYRTDDIVAYLKSVCKRQAPTATAPDMKYEDVKSSDTTPVFVQYVSNLKSAGAYATIVRNEQAFNEVKSWYKKDPGNVRPNPGYDIFVLPTAVAEAMFQTRVDNLPKAKLAAPVFGQLSLELVMA